MIFMDTASAELTKYAANAMLATRISFMNELSQLCEHVGADIESIRRGIGSDERIGSQFLYAGMGFGGSCFPKDVKALLKTAEQNEVPLSIVQSVLQANERQKKYFISKIRSYYQGGLRGLHFALWGLSFKPGTDDLMEAPALDIVRFLIQNDAHVAIHDPVAMENGRQIFSDFPQVKFAEDPYQTLEGADALIIATEWKAFKEPDFAKMKDLLKSPVIFDGRNLYDRAEVETLGFKYFSVGRQA
jgi:UDPglucose 6-dehydrogenase